MGVEQLAGGRSTTRRMAVRRQGGPQGMAWRGSESRCSHSRTSARSSDTRSSRERGDPTHLLRCGAQGSRGRIGGSIWLDDRRHCRRATTDEPDRRRASARRSEEPDIHESGAHRTTRNCGGAGGNGMEVGGGAQTGQSGGGAPQYRAQRGWSLVAGGSEDAGSTGLATAGRSRCRK